MKEKWQLVRQLRLLTLFLVYLLSPQFSASEISKLKGPKIFQLYYHKDKELTKNMIDECKEKKFDALALTVDTITGGNRERDLKNWFYLST